MRQFFRRLFCLHLTRVRVYEKPSLPWLQRYRCTDCGKARDYEWPDEPINYIGR